jgi:hypothetical protein
MAAFPRPVAGNRSPIRKAVVAAPRQTDGGWTWSGRAERPATTQLSGRVSGATERAASSEAECGGARRRWESREKERARRKTLLG